MKYTFTFPSFPMVTGNKITVIITLRQLCPGLGLKEAKDMIEQGARVVLDIGQSKLSLVDRNEALDILRQYGVVVLLSQSYQSGELPMDEDHYDYDYSYDQDYSETPECLKVETDTVGDLRTVAIAALDRGEYDIAIALIQMIRDFK
jgi:hypothetical protein